MPVGRVDWTCSLAKKVFSMPVTHWHHWPNGDTGSMAVVASQHPTNALTEGHGSLEAKWWLANDVEWCRIVLKRSKAKVYPHFFPHLPFQIRQLAVGKNKGLGLLKSCMFLSKAFTRKKRYLAPGLHTRCWKPVGWKQHGVWKSGIVRQHLNETWKV